MPATDRAAVLASLQRTIAGLAPLFAAEGAVQARAYAPGKWTLREVLLHLTDCQAVFYDRLCRLAAEDEPLVLAFDENRWAERLGYAARDLAIAGAFCAATAAAIVDLVRALPTGIDARQGRHSQAGPLTFGAVLAKAATHAAHHTEQAHAAAAGRTWAPAA